VVAAARAVRPICCMVVKRVEPVPHDSPSDRTLTA
jgi:hypothetical protein